MPINVTYGSTVQFTVEFFDSSQILTIPSSATITITYPISSQSLTLATCAISMTITGSYYTASWGTTVAALGLSSYSVTAPGQATATTGTLRIIS